MKVSDELRRAVNNIGDPAMYEDEHEAVDYFNDAFFDKYLPRIVALEFLLKEWMSADPPEKYDDRVMRTHKALEASNE